MKVIFMGTAEFACPALLALINSEHEVVSVFTQEPRKKNRGMMVEKSPIHKIAEEKNIKIHTPVDFKDNQRLALVLEQEADIIVVAAYGLILPESILYNKKFGCINIHPSKLPKWRGAAPLQRTIIEGDTDSAICIIQMDKGLDTGDILMQEDFLVSSKISLKDYHDFCANLGAELLLKTLSNIKNITPKKQDHQNASYAKKLSKDESYINFSETAHKIDCMVRGMTPWPGVFINLKGELFKILEVNAIKFDSNNEEYKFLNPGQQILSKTELIFKCSPPNSILEPNAIEILKIQPANKKPITGKEFLMGYSSFLSN